MRWWQIGNGTRTLEHELQSDLKLEEEERRERGVSPEEARCVQSQHAFGNPTLIHEQWRTAWNWNRLENLLRDLRISIRTLLRSLAFQSLLSS